MSFEKKSALPSMRWWHKWIGISVGLLLLAWLVSGILLVLPGTPASRGEGVTSIPVDVAAAVVTPAQAVAAAAAVAPNAPAIREVRLTRVMDTLVYVVQPMRGEPTLVHAVTGARFTISAAHAAAFVTRVQPGAPLASAERLTARTKRYRGSVPVHHLMFADAGETEAYVAENTGELKRTQRRDRWLTTYGHNVHVLSLFARLPGGQNTRKLALIGGGLLAILIVSSGYWLAIPRRLLRKFS